MSTHATFLSKSPAKATWTSNARTNLRTKKESWPNTATDLRACARWSRDMFSKDATLATTKLSKIICGRSRARSHTTEPIHRTTTKVALPMDRGRQGSTFRGKCLTSLWPLAVACPPVGSSPFGGNAQYIGPRRPCQTSCKIDFTPVQLAGKGVNRNFTKRGGSVKLTLIWAISLAMLLRSLSSLIHPRVFAIQRIVNTANAPQPADVTSRKIVEPIIHPNICSALRPGL
jgi:hypothetical protein